MSSQAKDNPGTAWRSAQAVKANNWKQVGTVLTIVAALIGVYLVLWYVRASSRLDDDVRAVLSASGIDNPTSREIEEMRALIRDASLKSGRSTGDVAASMAASARAR